MHGRGGGTTDFRVVSFEAFRVRRARCPPGSPGTRRGTPPSLTRFGCVQRHRNGMRGNMRFLGRAVLLCALATPGVASATAESFVGSPALGGAAAISRDRKSVV